MSLEGGRGGKGGEGRGGRGGEGRGGEGMGGEGEGRGVLVILAIFFLDISVARY